MILRIIAVLTLPAFLLVLNPVLADSHLSINEFLAHPSSGNKEWVEFYNPENIDLSGYFLDDDNDFTSDAGSSAKKSLSGLNKTDQTHSFLEFDSFLNNSGDSVVLFAPDGNIIDQYSYDLDPGVGIAIGRSPDGNGQLVKLTSASKGLANSLAQADPTPISENVEPSPTPKSTSQATSMSSPKTVTPTPAKSPVKSPATQTTFPKSSSNILGQATESTNLSIQKESSSPSLSPDAKTNENPKNTKVAYFIAGLGTILITVALIFYFLSFRKSKIKEKENDEDIYNQ